MSSKRTLFWRWGLTGIALFLTALGAYLIFGPEPRGFELAGPRNSSTAPPSLTPAPTPLWEATRVPSGPEAKTASPKPEIDAEGQSSIWDAASARRLSSTPAGNGGHGVIRGTVTDLGDGTPLAGATLKVRHSGGHEAEFEADREGRFGFSLPEDATFDLFVAGKGYIPYKGRRLSVGKGSVLTIRLKRELRLSGKVIDLSDRPVAGAKIWLRQPDWPRNQWKIKRSGPGGYFEFLGFSSPRIYTVEASHVAGRPSEPATVELPTGELLLLRLRMASTEENISSVWGVVTDDEGAPFPKAEVALVQNDPFIDLAGVAADERGLYRFPRVTPGSYTLVCSAEGSSPGDPRSQRSVELRPGESHRLDFSLLREEMVFGRVVSASGEGIARARISAIPDSGGGSGALSDAEGNFALRYLAAGPYRLVVSHADFQTFESVLQVPARDTLMIVLEGGLTLSGVANDAKGLPLSQGSLAVFRPGAAGSLQEVSLDGSTGAFEIRGLPAGALELRLRLSDGRVLQGAIDLQADQRVVILAGTELQVLPY
jgi:protocatechuate 3,4-dioxygenase beta subunit